MVALSAEVVAYPLLLTATYVIYRVGRGRRRSERFEWARAAVLATLCGIVMALQVRFVASGQLRTPIELAAAVLSIAGVVGLVGLNLMDVNAMRRAGAPRLHLRATPPR